MTDKEKELVVEYLKENVYDDFEYYCKEFHKKEIRDRLIEGHYDTLAFKLYALKHAWKQLWKPLFDWLK